MIAPSFALALILTGGSPPPPPLQAASFEVRIEAGTLAPLVRLGDVLADPALEEAARSGLPLRLHFTVELWRDRLFDALEGTASWTVVVAFEPLDRRFLVRRADEPRVVAGSYDAARAEVERTYAPAVRPRRPGRHYYIATLEVETLSLSDVDELERWLGGELRPAVQGGRGVPGAVGSGVKRLLIRLLDLPTRRFQSRSAKFGVP